jgi:8-oxo-dGTP pyrophosphatase MutT (NUDIX family)
MVWTHPTRHDCWPATALTAVCAGEFAPDATDAKAVDAMWERIRQANPTVFDGPVLHVEAFDRGSGEIRCRLASYRHLAVRRQGVETGIRGLGVSGLLQHEGRVLLAQRAASVHLYPGKWELAPSGTATPQAKCVDLSACLLAELREEVGLVASPAAVQPMMLAYDATTRSYDACFRIDLPGSMTIKIGSEYGQSAWCTPAEAQARREELIPVSQMMLERRSG